MSEEHGVWEGGAPRGPITEAEWWVGGRPYLYRPEEEVLGNVSGVVLLLMD